MPTQKRCLTPSIRPLISVIIPAFNEAENIDRCLASLADQDVEFPFEVVVVNGPSADATGDIAREYGVITIELPDRGIGLAWKAGARAARASILAFTEADCAVPQHWLASIKFFLDEKPEVIGLSGQFEYFNTPAATNTILRLINLLNDRFYSAFKGTVVFRGKNFAIHSAALHSCGGFDAAVQAYGDVELSMRAKEIGPILYVPALVVQTSRRNIENVGSWLRFAWRFLQAMYYLEIARRPHEIDIEKLLPQTRVD